MQKTKTTGAHWGGYKVQITPGLSLAFDISQKFFYTNVSYIIQMQKIRKIRKMQNPDKNPDPEFREKIFFLNFLFFNCEQFLLNKFSSKMVINPKKVCFLHFSYLPASASRPNCIYNLCSKIGLQNGKEFDLVQVRTRKISGKKPDPENPGKIRI